MDEKPVLSEIEMLKQEVSDTPENVVIRDVLENPEAKLQKMEHYTVIETPESSLYTKNGNFVIRRNKDPEELMGLVADSDEFFELLLHIDSWTCCAIDTKNAKVLGERFSESLERDVKYLECTTFVSTNSPEYELRNKDNVRLATTDDIHAIHKAGINDEEFAGFTPQRLKMFIEKGLVAIAVEKDEVVAIVSAEAITDNYVMFMYYTVPSHRRKGLTSDGHFLVLQSAIELSKKGVTSIANTNIASIGSTTKFNYEPVSSDCYFIIGNPPFNPN